MKIYANTADAVDDLQQKGFTNDFQLFGNNLLWVQEKIFIKAGQFDIVVCHEIREANNNMDTIIVFGIVAADHHVKGILMNHYTSCSKRTPPVIAGKLRQLDANAAAY